MKVSEPWHVVPIKDVCEAIIDCVNKTAPIVEYETPYKMIRTSNVKDGWINLDAVKFVEADVFAKWNRRTTPCRGDVILTREAPLGEVGMIRTNDHVFLGQRLVLYRANPDKLDNRFLLAAFQSDYLQAQIKSLGSGATVEHMRVPDAEKLIVKLPSLPVQRRIGDILSAYDDLIENNTRRITILEQMAQMLYREWFVHFRFPGHENYRLIQSTLGEIPDGWQVSTLGDVTNKIGSGATPRGGKKSYQSEGISLIRSLNIYDYMFEMADLAFINDEQAQQLDNVTIEPNDVLLNITGASVGRCSMVPSSLLPARVHQHVAIVRADSASIDPFLLLDTINNDRSKQRLLGIAQGGATREALTKDAIAGFPILLPPLDLIRRYGQIAGPVHTLREKLCGKNENLRMTRDLLLPKLVSGEVSVEHFEKDALAQTV
jgi:type I restriction enzyme S subunit